MNQQQKAQSGQAWGLLIKDILKQVGVDEKSYLEIFQKAETNTSISFPSTFFAEISKRDTSASNNSRRLSQVSSSKPQSKNRSSEALSRPAKDSSDVSQACKPSTSVRYSHRSGLGYNKWQARVMNIPEDQVLMFLTRNEINRYLCTCWDARKKWYHLLWTKVDYLSVQDSKKYDYLIASTNQGGSTATRPQYLRLRIGWPEIRLFLHLMSWWDIAALETIDLTLIECNFLTSSWTNSGVIPGSRTLGLRPPVSKIFDEGGGYLFKILSLCPVLKTLHLRTPGRLCVVNDDVNSKYLENWRFLPQTLHTLTIPLIASGKNRAYETGNMYQLVEETIRSLRCLKTLTLLAGEFRAALSISNTSLENLDFSKAGKFVYIRSIRCPMLKLLLYRKTHYGCGFIPQCFGEEQESFETLAYLHRAEDILYSDVHALGFVDRHGDWRRVRIESLPSSCILRSETL